MTPLRNWEIKNRLRLALAILLAIVWLVTPAASRLDMPFLRQIVGFIFLTFIPGIVILRIHSIGLIESLLYSVGLSLAFVMSDLLALLENRKVVYDNGAAQIWAPLEVRL